MKRAKLVVRSADFRRAIVLAAIVVWGLTSRGLPSWAADAPAADFETYDVSLWLIDPSSPQANARNSHPSALPQGVQTSRKMQAEKARPPGPVGLLNFYGQPAANLDVDLRIKSGSFLAHWPPGEGLPNRLRWSDAASPFDLVSNVRDPAELQQVEPDHWITTAREGQSLFVRHGARSERFLAYDAELLMGPPVKLEGGPDEYSIVNPTSMPVYDVVIVRPTPEGVRVAWIDTLPPSVAVVAKPAEKKPGSVSTDPAPKRGGVELFDAPAIDEAAPPAAAPPSAAPADAPLEVKPAAADKSEAEKTKSAKPAADPAKDTGSPAAPAKKLFGGLPAKVDELLKAKPPAAGKEKAEAKPQLFGGMPAKARATAAPQAPALKGVKVSLQPTLQRGTGELAAVTTQELVRRLESAGLKAELAQRFVKAYGPTIFAGEGLIVACRVSPPALDDVLQLSVFPAPKKTVRVPIVVLRHADPQMGDEVNRLIALLGDRSYSARQAAHKRLVELGPLAFNYLQKALTNDDQEIVIRAERILLQQDQTPNAQNKAAQPKTAPAVGIAVPAVAR